MGQSSSIANMTVFFTDVDLLVTESVEAVVLVAEAFLETILVLGTFLKTPRSSSC